MTYKVAKVVTVASIPVEIFDTLSMPGSMTAICFLPYATIT
jgi:hypothetical protein